MQLHNIKQILDKFLSQKTTGPDIILCSNPLLKCVFLEKLVHHTNHGVIYLDFDMLYSGYVNSGIFDLPANVLVRRPDLSDWRAEITSIIQTTSAHEYMIIIDSLNGMMTSFGHKRLTLHSIMLMSSLGVNVNTRVIIAAITKKTTDSWKIPGGHTNLPNNMYTLNIADNSAKLTKAT